ncbi:MAG: ABC transporter ATP-binding protein [Prolixibacteraceae bacterium]|jgi:iron complex transport system ATP-binding protein|nr:ABC transporter ATP-binding protein [Prolixibacteraceae bacterium]
MEADFYIQCKGVSIGYKEQSTASIAVKKDISLHANCGEMVALIGGNGIGKSTLLKTIAGFMPPLSGELLLRKRPLSEFPAAELAREMSFVSTENIRVANLTVRELVGLGRFPYTNWFGRLTNNDQVNIDRAIVQTGLSGYENRPINRISDGERQRAMIARALAQDTRIMVLDEPTAFLDISNKYEIVRILHQLVYEQGKCIIFSTHDLNTSLTLADRIWLMLEDRVVEGIPEEMASAGYFEALFRNNQHLRFDPERDDFRIIREKHGVVNLTASGQEQIMAKKALERLGFEVIPAPSVPPSLRPSVSPSSSIAVIQQPKGWNITFQGTTQYVTTLEELCRSIKDISIQ